MNTMLRLFTGRSLHARPGGRAAAGTGRTLLAAAALLLGGLAPAARADWGDTCYWKDTAAQANWNGDYWWNATRSWDNHNPNYVGGQTLIFNNNNRPAMTNNFSGAGTNLWRIIFTNGTVARTVVGSTTAIFFDNGGAIPKVETFAESHTLNFPMFIGYSGGMEFNPLGGNITNRGALNNGGRNVMIYGDTGRTTYMAGVVSGAGAFHVKGFSTLALSNNNTFSGGVWVEKGVLRLEGHTNSTGTAAINVGTNGTLQLGANVAFRMAPINLYGMGTNSAMGTINAAAGGTLGSTITLYRDAKIVANGAQNFTLRGTNNLGANTLYVSNTLKAVIHGQGVINGTKNTGDGAIHKSGTNYYEIRPGPTLTGSIMVQQGELRLSTAMTVGGDPIHLGGGTILAWSSGAYIQRKPLTFAGNATLGRDVNGSLSITNFVNLGGADRTITVVRTNWISGVVSNGGIIKAGSTSGGLLVLSGANTYTGITRAAAGTLMVSNLNAVQYSTVDLNASDTGTLSFGTPAAYTFGGLMGSRNQNLGAKTVSVGNNNSNTTYSGQLSNGTLTKIGTGTLTLSGASTYAGNTTISAGTLALSGAGAIASSPLIVIGANAALDVSGLTTALTLASGQGLHVTAAGSASPATVATTTGKGLTTAANSPLVFGSMTSAGGAPLRVTGAGSITLQSGNSVIVTNSGAALSAGDYKLISIGAGNTTAVAGTAPTSVTVAGGGAGGLGVSLIISGGELYLRVSAASPDIALANNGTQVAAANVAAGSTAVVLHRFSLAVTTANATLNTVAFTTAGTYLTADITNLKLRYSTDSTLDVGDATLSTITGPAAAGAKSFTGLSQVINSGSTGYLFITADIAAAPTAGRTISVDVIGTADLTFAAGNKSGSTTAGGAQTLVVLPTLTSPTAIAIDQSSATLGANVTANGGMTLTSRGTVWGTATNPTGNAAAEGNTGTGVFTHNRTGLSQGTKYFYRGYAVNTAGTAYSPHGTFHTEPGQASAATIDTLTPTTMRISWTAGGAADGAIVVVRAGSAVAATPTDGTLHNAVAAFGSGADLGSSQFVVFRASGTSVDVTGLTAGTTYHAAVFAYKGTVADAAPDLGINYRQTSPATASGQTCPAAPANLVASITNSTDFTASWSAATGATGYRLDVSPVIDFGGSVSASISENIQSWTTQTGYGNYTQSIATGTVTMTQCIVSPGASATGVGTLGRVQMNATSGILALPPVNSVGNVVFHLAAGSADRSVTLEKSVNGGGWSTVATISGIGSTGAAYTNAVNDSGTNVALRLSSPSHALYVHDIFVYSLGAATNFVPGYSNRAVGATSVAVTNLAQNTAYYFRVRAEGSSCDSVNSSTATVTTTMGTPYIALANNGTQVGIANVAAGTANHILHKFQLTVTNAGTTLTGVGFTSAGTYAAGDLDNFKVVYSVDNSLATTGDNTLLGTISASLGPGAHSLASLTQGLSAGNTHYIFITADIAAAAAAGKTINISAVTTANVTLSSGDKTGSTDAGGAQTFTSAVTISNAGTPGTGNHAAGATDAVLFGFQISPATGSVDFTGLSLTTAGTATTADLSGFRVVYDANNNGVYDGGDSVVSGTGLALANPINFTITGQTGISAARRYLVIANVAASPTAGRTFTGSIANAAHVTTTGDESGTAAGNAQTIITVPTLTSPTATGIGQTAATLGATVSADGSSAVTSRGTVWGTVTNPAGNSATTGSGTGAFSHERTGLTQGTKYFYRGFAVNAAGTAYSPNGTFHTEPAQASNVQFANVDATTMRITWTAGVAADGAIVVVRAGNSTVDDPTDGTLHTANAAYGSAALGSSFVVYRGAATQVDVTGLSAATTYYVEVFAYKGTVATVGVDQGINYRQTSPATGNRTTLAAEPGSSPNSLSFTSVGTSGMTINWANVSTQVLVVVRAASDVTPDPVDGTTYTADSNFGGSGTALGGGKVVYKGNGTSVAVTGLSADTLYYVRIYNFNGGGGTENYRTSDELAGSRVTLATEPATSPNTLTFNSISTTGMTLGWAGVSTQALVAVRAGSDLSADPVDATTYTADANFGGSGTALGGGKVVYKGAGTSVAVSGLSAGTVYYVRVYNFNGGGGSENYRITTPLAGSRSTLAAEPTTHASSINFTAVGSSQMTVNWTIGNGANRIVVVKQGSTVNWDPADGVAPNNVNANFTLAGDQGSGNKIAYDGSGSSFTLTGLDPETTYHVEIFEYNGSSTEVNYYTGGTPPTGSRATTAAACVEDQVTFVQQTGHYASTWSAGTAGSFNNGTTEVGMYAQGSGGQAVAWRTFRTDGSGGGNARELQPGDRFRISVYGYSPYGILGASLNDGAATGSWANRHSNSRGYLECGNAHGDLYVTYNGGSSSWSGIRPWATTITMEFDILSSREFTANIVGQTPRYDLSMLNSPGDDARIDGYSIYYNDDWAAWRPQDAYWKQETTVTNLGYVLVGGGNWTNTIYGKITDGTNPKCTNESPNFLRKTGTGIVTLNNTNTYSLYTEIANGTLNIPRDSALGTPPGSPLAHHLRLTGAGAALVGTETFTLSANRGMTLSNWAYLAVASTKTVTYNGVIADGTATNFFVKNQAGELALGGNSTLKGGAYVDEGTLTLNHANALGGGSIWVGRDTSTQSAVLNLGSAITVTNYVEMRTGSTGIKTLRASETATVSGPVGITETGDDRVDLDVASGKTLTLSGVMSGGGGGKITKKGAGTAVLANAANTHNKKIQINEGTLSVSASRNLGEEPTGSYANKLTLNGGTLRATATFAMSTNYSTTLGAGNGWIEVDATRTLTYGAPISGSGAFGKSGAGILKLTGANTFTGPVTNSAGMLQIGDNGTAGSLTANIVNNAGLFWHRSDDVSYSGVISGTGTLVKTGRAS
jgi:autotransporter-associated beta strand protein